MMAKVSKFFYCEGANGIEEFVDAEIGQTVGFKSDYEQYGKIIAINGDRLTVQNLNGFGGHYIGGRTETTVRAQDCWID